MQKKIVFFIILSCSLTYLSAQSKIGLLVGVDYSQVLNHDFFYAENIINQDFSYPSLLFGIRGEHYLSKKIIIEVSISHTVKKGIARMQNGFDPSQLEFALQFQSLISSAKLKYEIVPNTIVGFGIANRYVFDAHVFQNSGKLLYADYNTSNLSFIASLGYNYKDFTFEVNYVSGKKFDIDFSSHFYDYVEKINSIDFRVIYQFKI